MMLKNMGSRVVLNGLQAFMPFQLAPSFQQKLVEMTDNNINACSLVRPVTSSSETWELAVDDFNSDEDSSFNNLYGESYQDVTSRDISQTLSQSTKSPHSYAASNPNQYQSQRSLTPPHIYHEPSFDVRCVQKGSSMLEDPHFQCDMHQSQASFFEFSRARKGLSETLYQSLNQSDIGTLVPTSTGAETKSSYTPITSSMNGPAYMNFNSSCGAVDPQNYSVGTNQRYLTRWLETVAGNDSAKMMPLSRQPPSMSLEHQPVYDDFSANDGLPDCRYGLQYQTHFGGWSTGTILETSWLSPNTAAQNTISPKLLTLNASPAMQPSSGSSRALSISDFDVNSSPRIVEEQSDFSDPEVHVVVKQPVPVRHRRLLPSKREASESSRTESALSDVSSSLSIETQSWRSDSYQPCPRSSQPRPKKIQPKPHAPDEQRSTRSGLAAATAQAKHHRNAQDDFLVKSKLAGMSYKEIRKQGNFKEAESTLRGRFRTLTKHKSARVRKPEWTENDLKILKKAVQKFSRSSGRVKNKVSWKVVAEYIADNGGSYHFGNATCRKRWDELQKESG